ncbi:SET domain [Seminavis robusta]|uniref:SET domain n=1 Tax=Seminavis robusta TaxID=568900 RepID=A0A9N8E127_9STRA|nr:SET domain [Seminavis robusta]|eukprot:Sro453_g146230.1 SET domain (306) ;mRNA; f:56867-57784
MKVRHNFDQCCEDPLALEERDEIQRQKAQRYGSVFVGLMILERWLELGDRPDQEVLAPMFTVFGQDCLREKLRQLCENPVDDLNGIKSLVHFTRRLLWESAVDPSSDDHLIVGRSKIPRAQQGLFAARHLPANRIICYYSGDIHSTQSSQSKSMLSDASYLLRIGTVSRQPWWYNVLGGNDNSVDSQDSRAIAALCSRDKWDEIVGEATATPELYVDPTNPTIKARYINDCLKDDFYNVTFVLEPNNERAAVVTLRDIQAGEELYVSYGRAYWDSMEATTGMVPQRLGASSNDNNTQQTSPSIEE